MGLQGEGENVRDGGEKTEEGMKEGDKGKGKQGRLGRDEDWKRGGEDKYSRDRDKYEER